MPSGPEKNKTCFWWVFCKFRVEHHVGHDLFTRVIPILRAVSSNKQETWALPRQSGLESIDPKGDKLQSRFWPIAPLQPRHNKLAKISKQPENTCFPRLGFRTLFICLYIYINYIYIYTNYIYIYIYITAGFYVKRPPRPFLRRVARSAWVTTSMFFTSRGWSPKKEPSGLQLQPDPWKKSGFLVVDSDSILCNYCSFQKPDPFPLGF